MSHLGRSTCRRAAALTAAMLALPVSAAVAGEAPSPQRAPHVFAMPITPERVVVAIDAGSRDDLTTAVVQDDTGRVVGRTTLTASGKGLVPLSVATNTRQRVRVTIGNAVEPPAPEVSRVVVATTETAYLRTSSWRVVNKRTPLAPDEAPSKVEKVQGVPLDERAAVALRQLLERAKGEKVELYPSTGLRSYGWQQGLYDSYVRRDGRAAADTYSARPGFSEHQTGLTFDAKSRSGGCDLQECFGKTPAGAFLREQAGSAGFVVRYTEQNTKVTGYQPEPWHLRYVGQWLSGYLEDSGKGSLEDAFAMPPAPSYDR